MILSQPFYKIEICFIADYKLLPFKTIFFVCLEAKPQKV